MEDTVKLQDIDCSGSWARKWGTRFQPIKCNIMQLTNKWSSKIQASYKLQGTVLENVESIKYFSVRKYGTGSMKYKPKLYPEMTPKMFELLEVRTPQDH